MKNYLYTICFLALSQMCFAQNDVEMNNILQQAQWNSTSLVQLATNKFDISNKKAKGSSLLWEEWESVEIELKGGRIINDFDVNYDLDEEDIVLRKDGRFYSLPLKYISGFGSVLQTNSSNEKAERTFSKKTVNFEEGIYETLATGKYSLYRHIDITVKKANYNAAINVGDKRPTIKQIERNYIVIDGEFVEVPSKRKKALKSLKKHTDICDFINENKLDTGDSNALKTMIIFLNQKN